MLSVYSKTLLNRTRRKKRSEIALKAFKMLHVLSFAILLVRFSAAATCIDYHDFDLEQLESDIRGKLDESAEVEQVQIIYDFLSTKYCWLYWLVAASNNKGKTRDWNDGFWSTVGYWNNKTTSAYGAMMLKGADNKTVDVAWGNTVREWERWQEFREIFVNGTPSMLDPVSSECI